MRPETQREIDEAWQIEQDETSRLWNVTIERALPGPFNMWAQGELEPIKRAASACVRMMHDKSVRLKDRFETVLDAHQDAPTDADRAEFERHLDQTLREDVSYANRLLGAIPGCTGGIRVEALAFLDNNAAQDRRAVLHDLRTMLVAMNKKYSSPPPAVPSISVIGNQNVIGSGNANSGNQTVLVATGIKKTGKAKWMIAIIGAIVVGLLVAFIAHRMGWNK